jgi:hypothetical protein
MRNKRINIGWLGEFFEDERHKCLHAGTETHKGDLLTKEMASDRFEQCKRLVGLGVPACIAQLVVHNGVAMSVSAHMALVAGDARAESAQPEVNVDELQAGVNCWVVDTGSGHNLVPRDALTQSEKVQVSQAAEPLRLSTANGIVKVKDATRSQVTRLGRSVCARVLDSTPRVLSVQYLVEQEGASFSWTPQSGAQLLIDGEMHKLPVKQGVPLLALPATVVNDGK